MLIRSISIKEDIRVIVILMAYGIFVSMSIDLLKLFLSCRSKRRKTNIIRNYILQVLYGLVLLFISYNVSYKMANGYVPIYFMIFVCLGILLYYFWERKYFVQLLEILKKIFLKLYPKFLHIISFLCYPKDTLEILIKPLKIIKNTFVNFKKAAFQNQKKKKKTKKAN